MTCCLKIGHDTFYYNAMFAALECGTAREEFQERHIYIT